MMIDPQFQRALTGTAEQPTVSFERVYPTSRADLWQAVTDPERVSRWLGAISGTAARVGDEFLVAVDVDDNARVRVTSCSPGDSATFDWEWDDEPRSVVRLELFDAEGGAGMRLHHSRLTPRTSAGYGGGWEDLLGDLATMLGAGPGSYSEDETVEHWQGLRRHSLTCTYDLPAAPETVWRALTTADGLKAWWWRHWSDVQIDADVRAGGEYRIEAPDAKISLSGTYIDVTEARHLSYTWRWRDTDGTSTDEAVDIALEAVDAGTRLTVQHTGPWADDAPAESYRQGWDFTIGELAAVLDGA